MVWGLDELPTEELSSQLQAGDTVSSMFPEEA
jgi:hypothetical protein